MENIDNLICIYNENGNNVENILLKIYIDFIENELNKEFKS